jgi:hypothetical protein
VTLDIKYIYFLAGLSQRGYHATLTSGRGAGLPMSEYFLQYCVPEEERSKVRFPFWQSKT